MKIGIAFDLKPKTPLPSGAPDDLHEEFDSPVTIKAISEVLQKRGHQVIELGNGRELIQKLLNDPVDLVFNIAEGTGISRTREARVPALCEMLDIPYTGSDPLTLSVALDKDVCRRMVQDVDVQTPEGILVTFDDPIYEGDYSEFPDLMEESELSFPVIAKPVCEGSSKGIRNKCLIEKLEDLGPTVVSLWHDYKQPVLVEEFIAGEEVTVGIVGNSPPQVLGCLRVVPKHRSDRFIYSLEVKRNWEVTVDYECPAKLPQDTIEALESAALQAYDILGCRDITRIDFRVRDGIPYFIEANPLPGLNPDTGDICLITRLQGIPYEILIGSIFEAALKRWGLKEK